MVFDWSSWLSLVPFEPSWQVLSGQWSLNIIPESWKPIIHWKMIFDGCAWFSVVPFEPSWQAPPGQISLNIILESWKPVSHWKMVFDGCAWFLLFFLNPVGKLPQGKDPWILPRSLENLSVTEKWYFMDAHGFSLFFLTQFAGYCIFGRLGHE